MSGELHLEFTQSDVRGVAELIGAWLLQQQNISVNTVQENATYIVDVVTAVAGVYDPLGQLRQWLSNVLNYIASRIIASLHGIIDAVVGGLRTILNQILSAVSRIPAALETLASTFKHVVLDPLLRALDWVKNAFPTLIRMVQEFIDSVRRAIAEIPRELLNLFQNIANTLRNVFANAYNALQRFAGMVANAFQNIMRMLGELGARIQQAFSGILQRLGELAGSIANALQQIGRNIMNVLQQIGAALSRIPQMIASAVQNIVNTIRGVFENIVNAVHAGVNSIRNVLSGIVQFVSSVAERIGEALQGAFNAIRNALSNVTQFVSSVAQRIVQALQSVPRVVEDVAARIQRSLVNIANIVANVMQSVVAVAQRVAASIQQALNAVVQHVNAFIAGIQRALGQVAAFIENVVANVQRFVGQLVDAVRSATSNIIDEISRIASSVRNAFANFAQFVANAARSVVAQLQGVIQNLAGIVANVVNVVKDFVANLPRYAATAIQNVVAWIWEHLPDWVRKFLETAPKALERIGVAFTGFMNALLKLPEWFEEHLVKPLASALQNFARWLWEALPAGLYNALQAIGSALSSAVSWITRSFVSGIQQLWGLFISGIEQFGQWLVGAFSTMARFTVNALQSVYNMIVDVAKQVYDVLFAKPMQTVAEAITSSLYQAIREVLSRRGERGEISILFMTMLHAMPLVMAVLTPLVIGEALDDFMKTVELSGEPMGVGGRIRMRILSFLKHFAKLFRKTTEEGVKDTLLGISFNVFEPLRYVSRPVAKPLLDPIFRDVFGVSAFFELPSEGLLKEIVRRRLASGENETKLFSEAGRFFEIRGLPDELYRYIVATSKEWNITVHDRWGTPRHWPLSPFYEIPTISELATFMIKDMFGDPRDFIKAMTARGVPRDIALFFLLNHYRYPSVEKLAEFFWRGVAGELWNPDKSIDKEVVEIFGLQGLELAVKSPAELNYQVAQLYEILSSYLKWQDYARFPWRKGFPTDNAIITDLLADVPGKIDLRWMSKWGIFDIWGVHGVDVHWSIERITTELIGGGRLAEPYDLSSLLTEGAITMDVRQFSRVIQALGFHPYWVPWIAIAETINALSEERTLLRTGFINLFKEGFWDRQTLDKLLSGFVNVTFKVAYLDMSRGLQNAQWVERDVNIPVAFLPAETRLLELRALMDRALDILRDASRTIIRAYTENIVESYKDAMEKLGEAVAAVNAWFEDEMKRITGKSMPLKVDAKYWSAYAKVAEAYRDIYETQRIRYWVGRVLGWLFYRIAYGYVKLSDVDELVDTIAKSAKLLPAEVEMMKKLASELIGIAKREYIPTPSQLATIAEIVPEAMKLAKDVFEARGVPDEWQPIWLRYIELKPIADEVRKLLSTAITYYAKGVISDKELQSIFDFAKKYGWTDAELSILEAIAEIRKRYVEMREEQKKYIPTPNQLATIAEIVPEAVKLAKEVFEERHVPPEWQPVWMKYIDVKPVANEVRKLANAYARALRLGVDLGALRDEVLAVLKWAGWTEQELNILQLYAAVEQLVDEAVYMRREYLPTPMSLATLAEYVNIPVELIKETLEKRRVPKEWVEIWLRYIKVRPLADDARALAYAYFKALRYGVPLGELAQRVVEILRELGFTEEELKLRELRATIEAMIDEWRQMQREYIPTPSMLASIAEIVPDARRLLPEVLEKRHVPREWLAIWTRYVMLKPLVDEVRRLLSEVERLYTHFAIRPEEFRRWLERLAVFGYEPREIQLILARSEVERAYRAWQELVGTPRSLVTMAEYSPTARRVALGLVERMIDALPTDNATKQFLKQMWREYIKVKPVYDEVRRYITELINDYAHGMMTYNELREELEALREWGLDDYEIQFYIWLAERRRQRYARRRR